MKLASVRLFVRDLEPASLLLIEIIARDFVQYAPPVRKTR
jgi:hypothetical protein